MSALDNARHELFAQALAKGKTSDEAYVEAGYKPNRGNASTLKANQNILDRVAEIVNRGATRAEVTVESLLREAEEARSAAMGLKQISAAVAAIKEKGILSGVRIEKSERKNTSDVERLSDAELDTAIAEALAREQAETAHQGKPN